MEATLMEISGPRLPSLFGLGTVLLVGLVAWLVIVGYFAEPIAGPNYPEGLFYGIAAVPVLLLLWMMNPSKR